MSSMCPVGCWDLDLATGMLDLCPHSRKMFGLNPSSTGMLTEGEWVEHVHPDDLTVVRQALTDSLLRETPYAERFRTIHSDGSMHLVLGVGRPLTQHPENCRFVGWNFPAESAAQCVGDWFSQHTGALDAEHVFSIVPSTSLEDGSSFLQSDTLINRAKTILRIRQSRERLLGRAMIGEPAFDLLLHLYVRSDEDQISVSSLAKSAKVPYSSAVRWIDYLIDKDFVSRLQSEADRRIITVTLTETGRAVLDEFLTVQ